MSIPSLVRFGCADGVYDVVSHSHYLLIKPAFVSCWIVNDREVDVLAVTRAAGAHLKELKGQVIEGTSQVLDRIAGNKGNGWRCASDADNIVNQFSRLRVSISFERI